jgi:hypothetical protein
MRSRERSRSWPSSGAEQVTETRSPPASAFMALNMTCQGGGWSGPVRGDRLWHHPRILPPRLTRWPVDIGHGRGWQARDRNGLGDGREQCLRSCWRGLADRRRPGVHPKACFSPEFGHCLWNDRRSDQDPGKGRVHLFSKGRVPHAFGPPPHVPVRDGQQHGGGQNWRFGYGALQARSASGRRDRCVHAAVG